jgi:hypothetical protein
MAPASRLLSTNQRTRECWVSPNPSAIDHASAPEADGREYAAAALRVPRPARHIPGRYQGSIKEVLFIRPKRV